MLPAKSTYIFETGMSSCPSA